jgi:alkylation response protein AidB-like acyl-CoA dehydrogenase
MADRNTKTNGFVETARSFAEERLMAQAEAWERDGGVPPDVHRQAALAGLTLLMTPSPYRPKLPFSAVGQVAEELAAACLPVALLLIAHNYVSWSLLDSGRQALCRQYLPKMKAGESIGVFCLTEPQSGSDAAGIQTLATRTGNGFVLNGEKAWIMRAESADFFGVYAQTEARSGARGIAMFLIDAVHPGITRFGFDLFAGRAFGMGGFRLKNVEIPEPALLVEPGQGLRSALRAIDVARATVASMCCGLLRRGLEEAVSVTSERRAFGQVLGDSQGLQWMLADVATNLEASRALAATALEALDRGESGSVQAAHAKKFASRVCLTGLVGCMQVMGATSETASSRHLGYAKLAQYLDGATEIQNVVIARELYKKN